MPSRPRRRRRRHVVTRADADRDDRLAQRDDHDQAVTLGEVGRLKAPALRVDEQRAGHVERDRERPQRALERAVGERGGEQQAAADGRADEQPPDVAAQLRLVAARDQEEADLRVADDRVGAREQQRLVLERARDGERDDEERGHRGEHHEPHAALLGVDDARQPRVADPRPPHHAEHEQALGEALPRRVGGHQRRALGEREHEDEVEEQLERRDARLLAERRGQPVGAARRGAARRLLGQGVRPSGGTSARRRSTSSSPRRARRSGSAGGRTR